MRHPPGAVRIAGRALRAEWTKLRSVRSSGLALLAMVILTLLLTILSAALGHTDAYDGPQIVDQFHFVHQPMVGDGTLTARVRSQTASGAWAKAGIMIKADATSGSSSVALMVTPGHGVLLRADATTDLTASGPAAPCWLRLTRSGATVTGYQSADGTTWSRVGTLTVADLPTRAEAGLFVASPPTQTEIQMGSKSAFRADPTLGEAAFDHVTIGAAAGPATTAWQDSDVTPPEPTREHPTAPGGLVYTEILPGASTRDGDGTFTVRGSGDIGRMGMGGITPGAPGDLVKQRLIGVHLGLIGAVALGVLYMTSEFKTRTIGSTLAARPGRGYVLAAKAVVLTGVVFPTGLGVSVVAFFVAQPLERRNGYRPPIYPEPSTTDPGTVRAIVGTALFLTLIALFSLAVGTVLRRTAGAIIVLLALLVVIPVIVVGTSETAYTWFGRATPIAGLAIQQTVSVPNETVIGPWAGFAVLCGYTTAALIAAFWLLRRRDP